jgi:hypothetical protein
MAWPGMYHLGVRSLAFAAQHQSEISTELNPVDEIRAINGKIGPYHRVA